MEIYIYINVYRNVLMFYILLYDVIVIFKVRYIFNLYAYI